MKLYHTSKKIYQVGQIILISDRNFWSEKNGRSEAIIEAARPAKRLSRKSVCYAFRSLRNCEIYAGGLSENEPDYYYEVEMQDPEMSPMRLVSGIGFALEKYTANSRPILALADEYWSPKESWILTEYMSTSMKIIRGVPGKADYSSFWSDELDHDCQLESQIIEKYI